MKKIIVIGCPGSGKSTFARTLHKKTGIPLYHLDMMYWNADKTTVDRSVFLERLSEVLCKDSWIVDGNYLSSMDMRMAASDTVIFLDYGRELCISGVKQRRGKPRDDMPWVENEDDAEFLEFIENFRERQGPKIAELLDRYSDKNIIIFKNRDEEREFLRGVII